MWHSTLALSPVVSSWEILTELTMTALSAGCALSQIVDLNEFSLHS